MKIKLLRLLSKKYRKEHRKTNNKLWVHCDDINKIVKEKKNEELVNNKLWVHFHCDDIDKIDEIYVNYIENIMKKYSVIVTYSEGVNIPNYKFMILKIKNKGMDIDAVHFVKKFLNEREITYEDILTYNNPELEYFNKLYNEKFIDIETKKLNNNIIYENDISKTTLDDYELNLTNTYKIDFKFKILPINELKIIKDFILVIDFPNIGGGTTIFLNKIISKFKKYNTFLIMRNTDFKTTENKIALYLNDEYEILEKFSVRETELFLNNNFNKIQKIFVNHTLDFNQDLLNTILEFDKEKYFITHDFYSIGDNPQPYISGINECKPKKYLNKFSCIITQNECNLSLFSKFIYNKNCDIIISNLPDYKNKATLIKTKNTKIVIGIIGNISEIKGGDILYKISQYILYYPNIKLIVFGGVSSIYKKHLESYPYSNISELNDLLIQYSPNILLETSIWPETYSYTLTLSMITDLPILFLKKTSQFTVENRLSKYEKAHSFKNLFELLLLVFKHKQDFFYTIENNIYYNSFWNKLFNSDNKLFNSDNKLFNSDNKLFNSDNKFFGKYIENIIIITSKIYISNEQYTYSNIRSIYTTEERLTQTIETINSIRLYFHDKDYCILLIDNSKFNDVEYNLLNEKVDILLTVGDIQNIDYYTDKTNIKGVGEAAQQAQANSYLIEKKISFKNLFKISGRYLLNNNFVFDRFNNDKNIFKLAKEVIKKNPHVTNYYYTSLYKISYNYFKEYCKVINLLYLNESILSNPKSFGYEQELPLLLQNALGKDNMYTTIETLGLTQNISVWNKSKYQEQLYI